MNPVLIEIRQGRPGFEGFIGSWLCEGPQNVVIDVGPSHSIPRLIASLQERNVDRVDLVLITHIHIDHAGGLADFLHHYPIAKVICHAKGLSHLAEPTALWAGSQKVLGELAQFYGPIRPVAEERLVPHTEARVQGLDIIETPGHAPHHLSFTLGGYLFAGEAGGTYHPVSGQEYVRPATPPRFFLETCLSSVDRLIALEDQPICYAHFGEAPHSHEKLKRYRDQLIRWGEVIGKEMSTDKGHLLERCMDRLLEKDPELKAFEAMEPEDQERERYFIANSVSGYIEYLRR